MRNAIESIPGLAEARRSEQLTRERAFVNAGRLLCGIEVRQLTLADFLILVQIGSPFVTGLPPTPVSVVTFLWFMREKFKPERGFWSRVRKFRFAHELGRINAEKAADECQAFVDEAFADSPATTSASGDGPSHTAWVAAVVGFLAFQNGWSEDSILKMPLIRIWQHIRVIQIRLNPEGVMFNPSDRVVGDWLDKVNAGRN